MGFYAPAQIVKDAREHNVEVRPICIERSYWDNVLEPASDGTLAVRLGFRQIKKFPEEDGLWLASARGNGYRSIDAVWRRAGLSRRSLARLAAADAFKDYGLNHREALWAVRGLGGDKPLPLFHETGENLPEIPVALPRMGPKEEVFEDYISTRLSLRDHPIKLLRPDLRRFSSAQDLRNMPDGSIVTVCGLVITRQRPGTASGVIFVTLEDDTAVSNVIVWAKTFQKFRKEVMAGRLLRVRGKLQREGIVTHVISSHIDDVSYLLDSLGSQINDGDQIDPTHANADEAKRPVPDRAGGLNSDPRPVSEAVTHALQRARYGAAGARHPREQAKKLIIGSRDFH